MVRSWMQASVSVAARVCAGALAVCSVSGCGGWAEAAITVPVIQTSPSEDAGAPLVSTLPAPSPRETYALSFAHGESGHWLAARELQLVLDAEPLIEQGVIEANAELKDAEVSLVGTAEEVQGRWWLGLVGLAPDASGLVVRMTAERDGANLAGWAVVIDSDGTSAVVPFVAEPTNPARVASR